MRTLEAKLQDITYGTKQYSVVAEQATEADTAVAVDLERGQNILEVGIGHAEFSPTALARLGPNPATFVSYDFFEHDTELTPIKTGSSPSFGSCSQFVVAVNDMFLKYLQKGAMPIELHHAAGISYRTVAVGKVLFPCHKAMGG